jgi:anti-sigma regulatory factor (Ser/Thr protein kinase)
VRQTYELTDLRPGLTQLLDDLERLVAVETHSEALAGEIRLIAEEALTNVVKYGYGRPERPSVLAELSVEVDAEDVRLEIRDGGTPFDPLSQPSPDLEAPPETKKEGGLGIYLLRSLADEVRYRREGGANVLSLRKRIG